MASKYKLTALCAKCQTATVGELVTDDDRAANMTHYVDDGHVCNPCGEELQKDHERNEAAKQQLLDAVTKKLAKLNLTPEELAVALGKV